MICFTPIVAFTLADATPLGLVGWLFFALLLVLLNGFFVAAEFAIVKARATQLETLAKEGRRGAAFVQRIIEKQLDAYLSACQLGITIASLALGWIGEPSVARILELGLQALGWNLPDAVRHTLAFVIAFSIVTALHIVVGEQVPKVLAIRKAVATSLWVVWPLHVFYLIFRPAIWLLNSAASWMLRKFFGVDPVSGVSHAHSAEELLLLVEGTSDNEVTKTERSILKKALVLSERHARDIMTPRSDVISLEASKNFEENLEVAMQSEHSRFPLIKGHLDNTCGVVMVKDMVRAKIAGGELNLEKLSKPIMTVPEMMALDKLLTKFQAGGRHLAIVVDEHGGSVGIVCLEDVLETLVGEIRDEFDLAEDEKRFEKISEDEFKVHGALGLHEIQDHWDDLRLEATEVSTVGGYVTQKMGRLPERGEAEWMDGYQVTVESTDGRRIQWLRFQRAPEPETKPESDEETAAEVA